jgi:hypothetical protein
MVMKHEPNVSSNLAQLCAWMCVTVLVLAGLSPASAEEQNLKDGTQSAGQAAGSASRDIDQGAKTASKEIGQFFKNVSKAIDGAAKEGSDAIRGAVKSESR